ncbi:MAG: phage tail sheath family protein, partial [Gammaproteobacteria bacterium]|nr:phage tail sheath family protein [Gammaproteobacteria bacterium]
MPQYHHGARVIEVSEGARPIRTANSAVIGVVITAPKGPINTPTLIAGSRASFAQTFGSGYGTVDDVVDGIFDQIGALCVVVNVLDPATHKAAVAGADYTFDATLDTLTVADTYIRTVVVKNQAQTVTYVEGDDYTYDMETGEFTRVATGTIVAGDTVNIAYDIPDASLVTSADVIGTVALGT